VNSKSEYIRRAERLEAQAAAFDDPVARAMLQALIDALYEAARAAEADPGSAKFADPAIVAEFAASAPEFRRTASALRRRIAVTIDREVIDDLGKLADEYDLLVVVVDAFAGTPETR
jgi:hypothetical protein